MRKPGCDAKWGWPRRAAERFRTPRRGRRCHRCPSCGPRDERAGAGPVSQGEGAPSAPQNCELGEESKNCTGLTFSQHNHKTSQRKEKRPKRKQISHFSEWEDSVTERRRVSPCWQGRETLSPFSGGSGESIACGSPTFLFFHHLPLRKPFWVFWTLSP